MVDYKIRNKNIKELVESDFYKEMYVRMKDRDGVENQEKKSACIFNTILLVSQIVDKQEQVKKIVENFLKNNYGYGKDYLEPIFFTELIVEIEKVCNIKLNKESICEALCHGCAVHFTTLNIAKSIEDQNVLKCGNSFMTKEEEQQIKRIAELQKNKLNYEDIDKMKYLWLGWGYAKGISMGSQTSSFWMHSTPESMVFLFGAELASSGYNDFREHIQNCTDQLEEQERISAIELLEKMWNRVVGNEDRRGCILINRDDLEYEVDTYWNENPPRKVERRPYSKNSLEDVVSLENPRCTHDIIVRENAVISVPMIQELEKYKNENLDKVNIFSAEKGTRLLSRQVIDRDMELF